MSAALKTHQRTELARLARDAWMIAVERGEERDFNTWRHDEVQAECNKRGLTCCNQDDYAPLQARWHAALGEEDKARYWRERAFTEPLRVARVKLQQALAAAGLAPAYAETICRAECKCGLDEATRKQLWRLVYTINNRAKAQHREEAHA